MTIIETMARAIAKADFESRSDHHGFVTTFGEADDFAKHRWQLYEGCARAALRAVKAEDVSWKMLRAFEDAMNERRDETKEAKTIRALAAAIQAGGTE